MSIVFSLSVPARGDPKWNTRATSGRTRIPHFFYLSPRGPCSFQTPRGPETSCQEVTKQTKANCQIMVLAFSKAWALTLLASSSFCFCFVCCTVRSWGIVPYLRRTLKLWQLAAKCLISNRYVGTPLVNLSPIRNRSWMTHFWNQVCSQSKHTIFSPKSQS